MSGTGRWWFVAATAIVLATSGCGGNSSPQPAPAPSNYEVVAFSDLHFNPLYDGTLYNALVNADASRWAAIFQNAKTVPPSTWGTDTNYPLLVLALAAVKQRAAGSPVILFTGDLLGHGLPEIFYAHYYNRIDYPTPDPDAVAAMQAFVDKTVWFVTSEIRQAAGDVPVVFAIGNIDSYASHGPDSLFLANNAETFYTQLVAGSVEHQGFLNTFTSDGYFSAQPLGANLRVISLNTNSLAVGGEGSPDTELGWLDYELSAAEQAGQAVWLLMHVPPGADTQSTATNAAKANTPAKITDDTVSMMMVPNYQLELLTILAKYPGVVTLVLGAHTHMDEYRMIAPGIVLDGVPGISPIFGGNPAFKIFTIASATLTATDYQSIRYNLSTLPQDLTGLYTFSTAYSMRACWVPRCRVYTRNYCRAAPASRST